MIEAPYIHRHRDDPSQQITYDHHYNGMLLPWQHGPFIYNRLKRIDQTIQKALGKHDSLVAIRVSLSFPFPFTDTCDPFNRQAFDHFIHSLAAVVRKQQRTTERQGKTFYPTEIHYIWLREIGTVCGKPRYRCVLLFNQRTFSALGKSALGLGSLADMIKQAWARTLGLDTHLTEELVNISDVVDWIYNAEGYKRFFRSVGHLAKSTTNGLGSAASHSFGASANHSQA